jgi:hypothetical protein
VNANIATYTLTCSDRGQSISKQCNVQIAKPAIVLISNPKAVNAGESAALGWVTSGMQSCVISSPDLPQFTNPQTPPLSTGATFVLKCTTIGGGTREASTAVAIK